MKAAGGMKWASAQQLADWGLPGLPKTKRKINELAAAQGWALQTDRAGHALARKRDGKGGGVEYHISVLPAAAVAELVKRGLAQGGPAEVVAIESPRDQRWAWFDRQRDKVKAEARARLRAVQAVEAHEATGLTRTAAVVTVAAAEQVSTQTLWNWLAMVAGVEAQDRLPALAPLRRGGGREAEIDAGAWQFFLSAWLRPEKPTLAASYELTAVEYAKPRGLTLPHLKTFQRKANREVHPQVMARMRGGPDALFDTVPTLTRSVAHFTALQAINIDGHKWDVLVNWLGRDKPMRPMMVMIQDLYSRKVLAWRIAESESAAVVQLALADVFRKFGVPEACYFDNGRAFASKWITGAAKHRFRGRVLEGDVDGIAGEVGMKIHFTRPYSGRSKPIERAFRDLEGRIGKHPAFAGAYTGNTTENKPENYGSRAVDFDLFQKVVARGIELHNARLGRRTEMAAGGRSFDQVFNDSYAASAPRRLSEQQLRHTLLKADKVTTDRRTGQVRLFGNTYWSEAAADALLAIAGQPVVVRFDPEALHGEVHVYDLRGGFIATVPVQSADGFDNAEAARRKSGMEADARRKARELEAALDLLTAQELAEQISLEPDDEEVPQPSVTRLTPRSRSAAAMALATDATPRRLSLLDELVQGSERPAHLRLVETETGAGMDPQRPNEGASQGPSQQQE